MSQREAPDISADRRAHVGTTYVETRARARTHPRTRAHRRRHRHTVIAATAAASSFFRNGNGDAAGARDRRRGQHQGGLQVSAAQRLRGEGRLQVHRQVPVRRRGQLHLHRGTFSRDDASPISGETAVAGRRQLARPFRMSSRRLGIVYEMCQSRPEPRQALRCSRRVGSGTAFRVCLRAGFTCEE